MSEELKFEFNDYVIAIDEPYENDYGYVAIGKKQSNGINIVFKSPNKGTVNWFIELQKYITDLQSQLDQANEKLNEHNEYFKEFNCKDFKEFQDFISLFMLTPHEKLTLIKELQNQLNQANERLKGAIVLPVKLGDTIYVVPSRTNYQINIINNKEEKNKVSEFVVSEIRYNKYGYSIVCYIDYIPFYFNYETAKGYCEHFNTEKFYGETWFTTREEAEKKLQELKGE